MLIKLKTYDTPLLNIYLDEFVHLYKQGYLNVLPFGKYGYGVVANPFLESSWKFFNAFFDGQLEILTIFTNSTKNFYNLIGNSDNESECLISINPSLVKQEISEEFLGKMKSIHVLEYTDEFIERVFSTFEKEALPPYLLLFYPHPEMGLNWWDAKDLINGFGLPNIKMGFDTSKITKVSYRKINSFYQNEGEQ